MQLLAEPIETAPRGLQDRISSLEATIAQLKEENAAMAATQATLSDNQFIQLRLIHELKERRGEPTYAEASRAEKIERYLAARSDHRATYATLRGILGVDKDLLNGAIRALLAASPGKFKIVRAPGDRRKRALVMLPK